MPASGGVGDPKELLPLPLKGRGARNILRARPGQGEPRAGLPAQQGQRSTARGEGLFVYYLSDNDFRC